MRKKLTCLLAVFACILALTACGGTTAPQPEEIDEDIRNELFSIAETTVQQMDTVVTSGLVEQQKDNGVIYAGLQSWRAPKRKQERSIFPRIPMETVLRTVLRKRPSLLMTKAIIS